MKNVWGPAYSWALSNYLKSADADAEIKHIAKAHIRKENAVIAVIGVQGDRPALWYCPSFRPWRNSLPEIHGKKSALAIPPHPPTLGKCLHRYFNFIDPALELVAPQVPT